MKHKTKRAAGFCFSAGWFHVFKSPHCSSSAAQELQVLLCFTSSKLQIVPGWVLAWNRVLSDSVVWFFARLCEFSAPLHVLDFKVVFRGRVSVQQEYKSISTVDVQSSLHFTVDSVRQSDSWLAGSEGIELDFIFSETHGEEWGGTFHSEPRASAARERQAAADLDSCFLMRCPSQVCTGHLVTEVEEINDGKSEGKEKLPSLTSVFVVLLSRVHPDYMHWWSIDAATNRSMPHVCYVVYTIKGLVLHQRWLDLVVDA